MRDRDTMPCQYCRGSGQLGGFASRLRPRAQRAAIVCGECRGSGDQWCGRASSGGACDECRTAYRWHGGKGYRLADAHCPQCGRALRQTNVGQLKPHSRRSRVSRVVAELPAFRAHAESCAGVKFRG